MPKNMPFSEAVPAIIRSMYVVLTRFFLFAARNPHLGSRGESICKSIQEAYHAVGKVLLKELLLNGNDTPLSKACQVSIDAAVFAKSSVVVYQLLEAMLKQFHWTDSLDSHLPMALQVINKNMVAISLQAQDMVFELLSRKIDDLLGSLVFINFNPTFQQHQGAVLDCHEEVNGIIDFLRVTLMWLTHLPHSAREAAHFTCCSKVANGLMEYLLSNKVATVNYIAIACFHADVKRLEAFAEECAIVHLGQCFAEFHDLIKAMLYADLGQLIENVSMRRQLFPRLDPLKLCILMDKVIKNTYRTALYL